jgi:hypothetical protein
MDPNDDSIGCFVGALFGLPIAAVLWFIIIYVIVAWFMG